MTILGCFRKFQITRTTVWNLWKNPKRIFAGMDTKSMERGKQNVF